MIEQRNNEYRYHDITFEGPNTIDTPGEWQEGIYGLPQACETANDAGGCRTQCSPEACAGGACSSSSSSSSSSHGNECDDTEDQFQDGFQNEHAAFSCTDLLTATSIDSVKHTPTHAETKWPNPWKSTADVPAIAKADADRIAPYLVSSIKEVPESLQEGYADCYLGNMPEIGEPDTSGIPEKTTVTVQGKGDVTVYTCDRERPNADQSALVTSLIKNSADAYAASAPSLAEQPPASSWLASVWHSLLAASPSNPGPGADAVTARTALSQGCYAASYKAFPADRVKLEEAQTACVCGGTSPYSTFNIQKQGELRAKNKQQLIDQANAEKAAIDADASKDGPKKIADKADVDLRLKTATGALDAQTPDLRTIVITLLKEQKTKRDTELAIATGVQKNYLQQQRDGLQEQITKFTNWTNEEYVANAEELAGVYANLARSESSCHTDCMKGTQIGGSPTSSTKAQACRAKCVQELCPLIRPSFTPQKLQNTPPLGGGGGDDGGGGGTDGSTGGSSAGGTTVATAGGGTPDDPTATTAGTTPGRGGGSTSSKTTIISPTTHTPPTKTDVATPAGACTTKGMCAVPNTQCIDARRFLDSIYTVVSGGKDPYSLNQDKTTAFCRENDSLFSGAGAGPSCDAINPACDVQIHNEYNGVALEGSKSGWKVNISTQGDATYDTVRTQVICAPKTPASLSLLTTYTRVATKTVDPYTANQQKTTAWCDDGDLAISGGGTNVFCDREGDPGCATQMLEYNGRVVQGNKEGWASEFSVPGDAFYDTVQTTVVCLKKSSTFDQYLRVYHVVNQGGSGATILDQNRNEALCDVGDIAIGGGGSPTFCDNGLTDAACGHLEYLEANQSFAIGGRSGWRTNYDQGSGGNYDTQRVEVTCIGLRQDSCATCGACPNTPPPSTPTPPTTPPGTPPETPPSVPPNLPPETPPSVPPLTPPGTPPTVPPGTPPATPPITPPTVPPKTPPSVPPTIPPTTPPAVTPTVPPIVITQNPQGNLPNSSAPSAASSLMPRPLLDAESIDPDALRELEAARAVAMAANMSSAKAAAPTAVCGNGKQEDGEECDDRNMRDFDGCSADCLLETGYCGDGIVQQLLGEQCEQSTVPAGLTYTCDGRCHFLSSLCGNGTVDPGEQCDLGTQNSDSPNAACRTNCGYGRCGDGIVDVLAEFCDDGNRRKGDGCSDNCTLEHGANGGQVFTLDSGYGNAQVALLTAESHAPVGQTGPASAIVMAAGAAAGMGYMRRKRR